MLGHDWDLFISHAGEDKASVARPLAELLGKRGVKVWYDEFALSLGDSLRRSIDRGLTASRFGLVILSPSFLAKEWPQRELDGLTARESDGQKVILPVWHNINHDMVARYSPVLADRLAVSTRDGLEAVSDAILHALVMAVPSVSNLVPPPACTVAEPLAMTGMGIPVLSSGCVPLDLALSIGGFPRGHIAEVYGPHSAGKTSLVLSLVKEAAMLNEVSTVVDADAAITPQFTARFGFDISKMVLTQPDNFEDAFAAALRHAEERLGGAIVMDGISTLLPKKYYDESEISSRREEDVYHRQIVEQGMQRMRRAIRQSGAVFLCTNRVIEKVGVMFGNPEDTPWPTRWIKDLMSIRLDIRRIGAIKRTDNAVTGAVTRIKVVRTRFGPPFREAEFQLLYDRGIDNCGWLVESGISNGILKSKGSVIYFGKESLGRGRDAAGEGLAKNRMLYDSLLSRIRDDEGRQIAENIVN